MLVALQSSPNILLTKFQHGIGKGPMMKHGHMVSLLVESLMFLPFCLERDVFIQQSDHQALLEAEEKNKSLRQAEAISVIHPKMDPGENYVFGCAGMFF